MGLGSGIRKKAYPGSTGHKGTGSATLPDPQDCTEVSSVQSLAHHNSKHTGDFQFHCKTCAKGFNNFKLLEEHEHIHTGALHNLKGFGRFFIRDMSKLGQG
jgi:hypothetical protein